VQFCFSQKVYPKLITIDGDTVVAFKPEHINKMNVVLLRLDECNELNLSLEEENILLMKKDSVSNAEKINLTKQNEKQTRINGEKTGQVDILTKENKKQDKRINSLKKSRTLFTLGGVILGSAATYIVTLLLE
jgi:hypothetical protein